MFRDRSDAGRRLADRLIHYQDERPVVLALPRGGVAVGFEIARRLDAPLDLILVRKIGAPGQPELALGAVVDGERAETVVNEDVRSLLGVSEDYLATQATQQLEEIERRRALYLHGRPHAALVDRTVIVVDDGIATGATVRAALRAVRRAGPRSIVLAVPVAPPDAVAMLEPEVDAVVCLTVTAAFGGISAFYLDFHQMNDDEVVDLLDRAAGFAPPPAGAPA